MPRPKGFKHSEETKQKMRKAALGRVLTEETKAKLSEAHKGKPGFWTGKKRGPMPQEWRDAIGAGNLGKKVDEEGCRNISLANTGRKRPDNTKRFKGVKLSEEHRRKLSASHKGKMTGKDNPQWGKSPAHGKRIEYKGYILRSTYEERFAKALDRRGIEWEYEPKRFDLGDCTYLPDFYLPQDNAYWEVKGWLGPNSQEKINKFRQQYPEIPLVVATKPIIEMMEI